MDFSPAASWGVGKGGKGSLISGWEDVGGMHDVRDALKEALELPTKYAKLLARSVCSLQCQIKVIQNFDFGCHDFLKRA